MPNFIVFYLIITTERSFLIIYFPLLYSFLFSTYFCKLYFIDYAITVVPIFPLCPPPPSTSYSLRQSPHHCSCPWVMHLSSLATPFAVLYFTSPRLIVLSKTLFIMTIANTYCANYGPTRCTLPELPHLILQDISTFYPILQSRKNSGT